VELEKPRDSRGWRSTRVIRDDEAIPGWSLPFSVNRPRGANAFTGSFTAEPTLASVTLFLFHMTLLLPN